MNMMIEDTTPDSIEQEPTSADEQPESNIWQSDEKFKWYVIRVASSHENGVITLLHERAKHTNMTSYFDQVLMPTEDVVEMRAGKKRNSKRKFFPGYILIQMNLEDDSWQLVQSTPRVSGFVGGTRDKPLPISEEDVNNIINRIEVGEDAPAPKTIYEPGEVIRVCDGPFNDFNGVVENVDYERNMVKVSVQILGRATPVELDFMQIEKT